MEFGLDITEQVEEFEELETAELETTEEELAAPGEQDVAEKPPTVFISYNRKYDEGVARHLYGDLSQQYEVFLDQESNRVGDDYVKFLEEWLDRAEFFIILISKGALDESDWVRAELEAAYRRRKEHGRPIVLPVRVAYTGPYPLDVSAYIGRVHALFWDDKNSAAHVAQLQAAISNKPSPASKPLNVGMDGMLVGDNRRARMAETFVAPQGLGEGLLRECKLLWLTGDADVRNYAALSLAAHEVAGSLYEVTRSRTWAEINNTGISDAAIVLRDALPSAHFDEATAGEELNGLRALIERKNVIIATAPDEEFERVRQEMLRYEFRDYEHRSLSRKSYNDATKLSIFGNLLDFALRSYDISEEQSGWARELQERGRFGEIIKKWSPSDIERFIIDSLPQAERPGDVARMFQRNAALEDEVHSWFLSLDDSTRCFVLAVILFPETEGDFLWEKYKSIVKELRRLDPRLSLQPFGICRQLTSRYISREGPIYVRDERVAEAVRLEVAKSYREYFVELTPRLREWTVPEGREAQPQEPQRKLKIKEVREERVAVARMVGCVGRLGLEDLNGILEFWATDPNYYVRHAVADALAQTAQSHNGLNHALNLLEQWCRETAPRGDSQRRACAAAIALGSLASSPLDEYATPRVLECVQRLARSASRDVRFHISIALRHLARGLPLASLERVLTRLTAEKSANTRVSVRLNVADALNAARARDPQADELWRQWPLATDEGRRWIAVCSLLIGRDVSPHGREEAARSDKYQRLLELLAHEETARAVSLVCAEVMGDERHGEAVSDAFKRLVGEASGAACDGLAAGLLSLPPMLLKRLLPPVRTHGSPAMEERLIEVWSETLKQELDTPELFVVALKELLAREEARPEAFKALALLVGSGPDGCRRQFVSALAERYAQDPQDTSALLERLQAMAPSHFDFLAPAVRREALEAHRLRDASNLICIRKPRPMFVTKLITRLFTKRS